MIAPPQHIYPKIYEAKYLKSMETDGDVALVSNVHLQWHQQVYMNTVVSDDDSLTHNLLVHKTKNNKGGGYIWP